MENIIFRSRFGRIELTLSSGRLEQVRFGSLEPQDAVEWLEHGRGSQLHTVFTRFLDNYFAGHPGKMPLEKLGLEDATAFQMDVFRALRKIGFGSTVSYGELARMAGRPKAGRAVGQALGSNPVPIFIPCHRVVRSDGDLGGFVAGKGWKRALLRHEEQAGSCPD